MLDPADASTPGLLLLRGPSSGGGAKLHPRVLFRLLLPPGLTRVQDSNGRPLPCVTGFTSNQITTLGSDSLDFCKQIPWNE